MNTANLIHDDRLIRCKGCGAVFEVSRRVLADPMALLELKEGIAAKHTCRAEKKFAIVRVWRSPTGEGLVPYWNDAMRRLTPAQS